MRAERRNRRYLPEGAFPEAIEVHDDLAAAVKDAVAIIIAVPSHALRALLVQLKPLLARDARLAWATKGFELDTGKLPHQVAYDVLGDRYPVAVLSGPDVRARSGHGIADGDDHRLARRGVRQPAGAQPARPQLSRLHLDRHRRRGSRRRGQERAGRGRRALRRPRIRRQHPRGADHARPLRGDAARRRARRAAGNLHGTRRSRRPGADQHRQPVAQPALRPGAGGRQERRAGAARDRPGGRGLQRRARRARRGAAREGRHAHRRRASIACCTKTSPPRTWSRTS